jgi:predicted AAA+ superfamily ATPase
MYTRAIKLDSALNRKSVFLFGPRQTGKSTLLRSIYPTAVYYDLLEADTFREISAAPELIRKRLTESDRIVIIDEIQKLPALLDEVHLLIERNKSLRFLLTGSSARKLKRGGANLLAGRALVKRLHPLVSIELGFSRLDDQLARGGLPSFIDSPDSHSDLNAYVGSYLQEEILAEGIVRSIESFSRFLPLVAHCNGEQVNYTEIASDLGVAPRTVREYFTVLTDTLVGYELPACKLTTKRKPAAKAKFYLFDIGVANTLLKRGTPVPGSEVYGRALEHLIFLELQAYIDYRDIDLPLTYWRSLSQLEVDFVIGESVAIEVKAKSRPTKRDLRGLTALAEELPLKRRIVVCSAQKPYREDDGTEIVPVEDFFRALWQGAIL